ncbi:MAG TPA: 6-carboxytetrahydropterin synthase [Dehalococcoidia bacterium]|jgi:6-pyruvoyltetrahydropterin/6-carboxytetrahydropterin synthase|nr:6-carboxytetrahydropterin synthase [Dehalococcoidia bacterium]
MNRYQVTKTIEFSYGHRLLNHNGKCRYLHGHNGMLEVDIDAEKLDAMGMVVDFSDVNAVVKKWVDENLDHRMLLCNEDPMLPVMKQANEPVYVMEKNPTAENIAALIWTAAHQAGLQVSEVRLWETSTSRATYRGPAWND